MTRTRIPLGEALEELIDHRGKTPKKLGGDWTTSGHRVISALNIKNNRIDDNDHHYISDEMYRRWMRVPLRKGDVLLTSEAPTGEVAYLPADADWALGQRVFGLRGKPHVLNGRYLAYLLRGGDVRQQLLARTTGTTVAGIRQSELVKVELDLPAPGEQAEIAATLGALDDKIDSNRRATASGESVVRALVASTLEISSGVAGTLGDYCSLVRSAVKSQDLSASDNYIGLEHMPRGSIFLTDWADAEGLGSNKTAFAHGDVLFGKLRPYFKKVGIPPISGVCSTDILVLRPNDARDLGIVATVAASDSLIDSLTAGSTGTRMPRAAWKDLASWPMPVLTTPERESLSEQITPLIQRLERLTLESVRLAALRDALLPELLSGRIHVADAQVVAS